MKKISSLLFIGSILVTMASTNVNAQSNKNSFNYSDLAFEPERSALRPVNMNAITPNAVRDFNNAFKNAVNIKWYNVPESGAVVYFTNEEIQMKSAYNKKGQWQYTLSFYDENKLSPAVRKLVKSSYYDFAISRVIEVEQDNKTIFVVYLEDATSLKTARVCNGEMEIVEDYKKSK